MHRKIWAIAWIIAGMILIINQMTIQYDVWIIIGSLALIKGIMILIMPHKPELNPAKNSRKR